MRIKTIVGTVLASGVVIAGATAVPASADLVTRCIGTGGAVTVPGDLVVPKGESCTLTGTIVEGDVRVQAGADLVVLDATLNGNVAVAADAYFDATTSSIGNTVTNRGFGVYLDRSQTGGDVRAQGAGTSSFTYLYNSDVAGQVDARAGELLLDSSTAAGQVRGVGTVFVDVINSTVLGDVTVRNNAQGTSICASEVDGDARFLDNAGVQLGNGDLLGSCTDGVNYFGGAVHITNNTAGVSVIGNIVRGDLSGTGNDPAPTGNDNRVRGNSTGQFADLGEATQARARMVAAPADRSQEAQDKVAQRRASALDDAASAGPAQL